ncbi:chloride channel protein [Aliiglaciecola lipolytica]|uniref:chloride channel protein n=1 Tax=Aliiglaciecola lipolytica TaxID=477689 RepID=UPI001C09232E|nr:chloride channel protein [Aliiglaciecola lipolytica]MBU2879417.1 chloride channel protein [Aliiglaciecola lipolytica]
MTLKSFRQELANPRTSIQLCILGIVGGMSAASLIIVFRLCVEWIQLSFLEELNRYSDLTPIARFAFPIAGALLIILFAFLTGFKHYRMGIPFVIHRLKQRYGHIPFRTTINQFFGGMIALASGFVVGREGPSVHLGAAGSSFIGHGLKLPYNSIRILSGCGIAAGISASFNTPFAAVIFVMEVVLREYRIHLFIPVMLAAACGSLMTRVVFGQVHELSFLSFQYINHWHYPYLVILGISLGCLATLFNNQLMNVIRLFRPVKMIWRILIAALITAIFGYFLPESLSASLDTTHSFVSGETTGMLIAILVAKFILALVAIGLGVPGGLIGPVYVIGMLAGAVLAIPLGFVLSESIDYNNSFALLGIAGMLTAVLHAPLAALSSIMELAYNADVILPAMLVIVPAYVTSTQLFGNRSIFIRQLEYQKLSFTISPIREALQKTGVLAVMDTEYKLFIDAPDKHIMEFLDTSPNHPVVLRSSFEIDVQYSLVQYELSLNHNSAPLAYFDMEGVPSQSTLAEVYEILQVNRDGAVYVYETTPSSIVGVITWNTLRNYLHQEKF